MRLNKWIAEHSAHSRRSADALITAGRVTVNGNPATTGQQVEPTDSIAIDGAPLSSRPLKTATLLLHKPVGYVCSRKGQGAPTVYSLIPQQYHHLDIAGRLDKDSSGLVVLTNDGQLLYELTHPSQEKLKKYHIQLNKPLSVEHEKLVSAQGVKLEDGVSKLALTAASPDRTQWEVTMHEGRNRQIRRTFEAIGYRTTTLHRTSMGAFLVEGIDSGKTRLV